jgi:hypothetical protein
MTPNLHTVGVALVVVAGLIAIGNGLWFVVGSHPFDDGGYSEEVDLTRAEAGDVTPELPDWLLHVSDQVGSVTVGWGAFVVGLGVLEHRRRDRALQGLLLIGGLPTLLFSAFGEHVQFGAMDTGSIISTVVLGLFVIGVGLQYVATRDTGSLQSG